jgi:hypothetical protein
MNSFVIIVILVGTLIPLFTILSVKLESVPVVYNYANGTFSDMKIWIKYQTPLIIPLKYWDNDLKSHMAVDIVNLSHTRIVSLQLISPPQPILSFNGDFMRGVSNAESTTYTAEFSARHNGNISNSTDNYKLHLYYYNATNQLNEHIVTFPWTIMRTDRVLFSYFWIVLAGVVSSRFIKFIFEKKDREKLKIDSREAVWIAFTFLIALIAFSSFQQNVQLTKSALANTSIAFGFGFTSQRVLELARLYPDNSGNSDHKNGNSKNQDTDHSNKTSAASTFRPPTTINKSGKGSPTG